MDFYTLRIPLKIHLDKILTYNMAAQLFDEDVPVRIIKADDPHNRETQEVIRVLKHHVDTYLAPHHLTLTEPTMEQGRWIILLMDDTKVVGSLQLGISEDDISVYNLRSKPIIHRHEQCLHIQQIDVDKSQRGKGLGSLLMARAVIFGLEHGCTFSTLDDASARSIDKKHNIYSKFGYTHKGVTKQTETTIEGDEVKQLPMIANLFIKVFKKNLPLGGTRRRSKKSKRRFTRRR